MKPLILIMALGLAACSPAPANTTENEEIAKYKRWVTELRAKEALSRSMLDKRAKAYEERIAELEQDRAHALANLDTLLSETERLTEEERNDLFAELRGHLVTE